VRNAGGTILGTVTSGSPEIAQEQIRAQEQARQEDFRTAQLEEKQRRQAAADARSPSLIIGSKGTPLVKYKAGMLAGLPAEERRGKFTTVVAQDQLVIRKRKDQSTPQDEVYRAEEKGGYVGVTKFKPKPRPAEELITTFEATPEEIERGQSLLPGEIKRIRREKKLTRYGLGSLAPVVDRAETSIEGITKKYRDYERASDLAHGTSIKVKSPSDQATQKEDTSKYNQQLFPVFHGIKKVKGFIKSSGGDFTLKKGVQEIEGFQTKLEEIKTDKNNPYLIRIGAGFGRRMYELPKYAYQHPYQTTAFVASGAGGKVATTIVGKTVVSVGKKIALGGFGALGAYGTYQVTKEQFPLVKKGDPGAIGELIGGATIGGLMVYPAVREFKTLRGEGAIATAAKAGKEGLTKIAPSKVTPEIYTTKSLPSQKEFSSPQVRATGDLVTETPRTQFRKARGAARERPIEIESVDTYGYVKEKAIMKEPALKREGKTITEGELAKTFSDVYGAAKVKVKGRKEPIEVAIFGGLEAVKTPQSKFVYSLGKYQAGIKPKVGRPTTLQEFTSKGVSGFERAPKETFKILGFKTPYAFDLLSYYKQKKIGLSAYKLSSEGKTAYSFGLSKEAQRLKRGSLFFSLGRSRAGGLRATKERSLLAYQKLSRVKDVDVDTGGGLRQKVKQKQKGIPVVPDISSQLSKIARRVVTRDLRGFSQAPASANPYSTTLGSSGARGATTTGVVSGGLSRLYLGTPTPRQRARVRIIEEETYVPKGRLSFGTRSITGSVSSVLYMPQVTAQVQRYKTAYAQVPLVKEAARTRSRLLTLPRTSYRLAPAISQRFTTATIPAMTTAMRTQTAQATRMQNISTDPFRTTITTPITRVPRIPLIFPVRTPSGGDRRKRKKIKISRRTRYSPDLFSIAFNIRRKVSKGFTKKTFSALGGGERPLIITGRTKQKAAKSRPLAMLSIRRKRR